MTLLAPDLTLFGSEDRIIQQAAKTHGGMAHFAGSGPAGERCRSCTEWSVVFGSREKAKTAHCSKYRRLMNGSLGSAFPGDALACKYFEQVQK